MWKLRVSHEHERKMKSTENKLQPGTRTRNRAMIQWFLRAHCLIGI
jgi:hypothetical protein